MRRLGKQLGVDPMAIYHHLPNKQAVIFGMVQRVFGEINAALEISPDAPWQQQVLEWARTYRRIARRHQPLVIHLISNAAAAGEEVMRANEALYHALSHSGMAPGDIMRAADLVVDYIHGVLLGERTALESPGMNPGATRGLRSTERTEKPDWRSAFSDQTAQIGSERLPTIAMVLNSLDTEDLNIDVDFEFGLGVIIAGLERFTQRA